MINYSGNNPYLSIIIPVYNDVDELRKFLPAVIDFCYELGQPSQIIVVDDGSKDEIIGLMQTFIKACQQAQSEQVDWNVDLQLLRLSRNFGTDAAVSAGYSKATGSLVTSLDCDGKHPLDILSNMIKMVRAQPHIDMIAAIRSSQSIPTLVQRIKASIYGIMMDANHYEIKPTEDNFRLMNRKVLDALNSLPERKRFMKGLYSWVGFHTVYLPYNHPLPQKKQKWTNKFHPNRPNNVTAFSRQPLAWITGFGIIFFVIFLLYGLYTFIGILFLNHSNSNYSLLMLLVLFLASIQFISLGIIGEYIGRLYDEIKNRPLFLIDNHLSSQHSSEEELNFPTNTRSRKTSKNFKTSKSANNRSFNNQINVNEHGKLSEQNTVHNMQPQSISQVRNQPLNSHITDNHNSLEIDKEISLNQLEELIGDGSIQLNLSDSMSQERFN